MDGIVNVIKPNGFTSFDVVAKLRKIYGQKKIGHGGTLDPMAEGVLPVFLGKATRLIEYAPLHTKTYEARFIIGMATDTEDATGEIIDRAKIPEDKSVWEKAAAKFRGEILQVPSAYSAIKVNGERAYKLAREGKKVELKARPVTIHELLIQEITDTHISLRCTCSSGTYIRALGRDLGKEAGTLLTMDYLNRTMVGPFKREEAFTLEEIAENPKAALIKDLHPLLAELFQVELTEEKGKDFRQGKRLRINQKDNQGVAVFAGEDFLGIGRVEKGILHPKKVFL